MLLCKGVIDVEIKTIGAGRFGFMLFLLRNLLYPNLHQAPVAARITAAAAAVLSHHTYLLQHI